MGSGLAGFRFLGGAGPETGRTLGLLQELFSNPQFIVDGATRTDICQGALGRPWGIPSVFSVVVPCACSFLLPQPLPPASLSRLWLSVLGLVCPDSWVFSVS